MIKNCLYCKTEFIINLARIKTAKFCSYSCRAKHNIGNLAPNFGNKHSKTSKYKMRMANWKGGIISRNGYTMIYSLNHPFKRRNGYVFEHRIIVEKIIGRYLEPEEEVHHINRIRNDNRPENLMVFVSKSVHRIFENSGNVDIKHIIFDGRNHI